ncbi:MAG TPA: sulfite exporter TauE/SafE family protein [Gaiellaceae bacterium]
MKTFAALLVALIALAVATAAAAHPLGNFTVNRFAGIELSGRDVYLHYVLDLAEIPTVQEGDHVRAVGFDAEVAARLDLALDGSRVQLVPMKHKVSERPGAGGLPTMRFEAVYRAALTNAAPVASGAGTGLVFHDENFATRIGWKEVVVQADEGARLLASDVPASSTSGELRAYPKDLLRSPLAVTSARARFEPGAGPGVPPAFTGNGAPERPTGAFESLIARDDLGAGVVLLSLVLAAFWGAAHALSPGHGKTMVAAYLVGSRGTAWHALLLGLTVTVTHTLGVFALGLVTLALSAFFVPEDVYPWLNLVAALLVVGVGVSVLRTRLRHRHAHSHGHNHHREQSLRDLLAVGISGGLLPCPTALVVLLAAISLHRVGYGLVLILAFSVGLAGAMTAVGLAAVSAKRFLRRAQFEGRIVQTLPALSALLILGLGVAMTARSIPPLA